METFIKLFSVSVLLQKAPLMLEDLQGMGAALPNLEEGSSLPFQNKVSGIESPAVTSCHSEGNKKSSTEVFLGRPGISHSSPSAHGAHGKLQGPAYGKPQYDLYEVCEAPVIGGSSPGTVHGRTSHRQRKQMQEILTEMVNWNKEK